VKTEVDAKESKEVHTGLKGLTACVIYWELMIKSWADWGDTSSICSHQYTSIRSCWLFRSFKFTRM